MDRAEFWARCFIEAQGDMPGAHDFADAALEEYDKRFTHPQRGKFTLDDLPTWDDLLDGAEVEGAIVEASFAPAQGMFVIKFAKNGLVSPIYTNQATEKDVRWEYNQLGLEWLQDGILGVDTQIDHEIHDN